MPASGGGHHFLIGGLFSVNHFRLDADGTLSGSALPHGVASLSPNGRWATVRVADSTYPQIENQFLVVDLTTQATIQLFQEQFSPEMHWKLDSVTWIDDSRFVLNSSVWGNKTDWEAVLVQVDSSRGTVEAGEVFRTRSRVCPSPDGNWLEYMTAGSGEEVNLEVRHSFGTSRGAPIITVPIAPGRRDYECPGQWSPDSRHILLGVDSQVTGSGVRLITLEDTGGTTAQVTALPSVSEDSAFSSGSGFLISGGFATAGCQVVSIATGADYSVYFSAEGIFGSTCLTSSNDEFLLLGDRTQLRMVPLLGAQNPITAIESASLLVSIPDGGISDPVLVPSSDQLLYWIDNQGSSTSVLSSGSVFWMDVPNDGGLHPIGDFRVNSWGMFDNPLGGAAGQVAGGAGLLSWGNRISPRGSYLASFSSDGRLVLYRLRSPLTSVTPNIPLSRFSAFAWAPDESGFFVARASTAEGSTSGQPQLLHFPIASGTRLELGPPHLYEESQGSATDPSIGESGRVGIWMPDHWD